MKKIDLFSILGAVLGCLILLSCGANKAELRQREVALRDLGKQYYVAGDHTTALRYLLEAEENYPDDHILQNYLGQVYLAKNKPEEAIVHFKRAIVLKPDYAVAKNNLGVVYLTQNDWDKAIAVFDELTGDLLYATPHYPLSNLGYAYYQKKQYAQSEQYYKKALELEPNYPPALRGLGRTYIAMGRDSEAVAALSAAIEQYPEFAGAYYDLGRAYLKRKEYRKAKAAFQKVVNLESDSELGRSARTALQQLRYVQ